MTVSQLSAEGVVWTPTHRSRKLCTGLPKVYSPSSRLALGRNVTAKKVSCTGWGGSGRKVAERQCLVLL